MNRGIACDISMNNPLAVYNSRLIQNYMLVDERARSLAMIVKYWARRRKVNQPYAGTLSPYAWVLLVINFLQQRDPPILPCLQNYATDDLRTPFAVVNGHDCSFYTDAGRLQRFGEGNRETLGELVFAFFDFYANRFRYASSVVSVRTGAQLTKAEKGWDRITRTRYGHWFSIEDPFETSHDLGCVADKETRHAMRWELRRAHHVLSERGDLELLLADYGEEI